MVNCLLFHDIEQATFEVLPCHPTAFPPGSLSFLYLLQLPCLTVHLLVLLLDPVLWVCVLVV